VALIKPQFEAGRAEIGKGGIIRDEHVRRRVVEEVAASAVALGLDPAGTVDSPIAGMEGNREVLMRLRHGRGGSSS
jgi:23S rRNA (cytidine1920-2'-O)/16S rRNA (cytidine1409-2'-O)-methyltransferase